MLSALERRGASQDWSKKKVKASERQASSYCHSIKMRAAVACVHACSDHGHLCMQAYSYLSTQCPKNLSREELQAFFSALEVRHKL